MSCLDFDEGKPFYLKFKKMYNGKEVFITQFVRARAASIGSSSDCTYYYGDIRHDPLCLIKNNYLVETNIEFECIPDKDGRLFTLTIDDT